jgi:Tfp pilus assembly protein PilO
MTKTRQWTVFTAVAVLVVLAAGWFLLVKPQNSKVTDLKSQATSQQQSNALIQTQISSLLAEQRQLPQQQQALQKFATQVPADASEPTIIRELNAAANGSGVDLISMTPGSSSAVAATDTTAGGATTLTPTTGTSGTLEQLPITLGVSGSYPNIESFFQSLEKLPRSTLVTGWSLCPYGTTSAGSSGGVSCTPPPLPTNKSAVPNELGVTISAVMFYAPPAGTTTTSATSTLVSPVPTQSAAPTTTSGSTAATPNPTAASTAPAS